MRRKDSNPGAVSQLVTLIEHVCDIEPDPEPAILFREVKIMRKAQIDRIIAWQFVRIRKAASQAAAIEKVSIHRGVFVGVRSTGGNGITLIVVQEYPMIANESEVVR